MKNIFALMIVALVFACNSSTNTQQESDDISKQVFGKINFQGYDVDVTDFELNKQDRKPLRSIKIAMKGKEVLSFPDTTKTTYLFEYMEIELWAIQDAWQPQLDFEFDGSELKRFSPKSLPKLTVWGNGRGREFFKRLKGEIHIENQKTNETIVYDGKKYIKYNTKVILKDMQCDSRGWLKNKYDLVISGEFSIYEYLAEDAL